MKTQNTDEYTWLLNCPMCGDVGISGHELVRDVYTVNCFNCFLRTDEYKTELEAREAWNTRHTPAPPAGIQERSKCLWDSIPEAEKNKPMGMVCCCIKCTAIC